MNYLEQVQQKRLAEQEAKKTQAEKQAAFKTSKANSETVVAAITQQGAKTRQASENLAKTDDVQQVVDSINKLNVTTFLASKDSWSQIVSDMASAAERIQTVMQNLDGGASKIDSSLSQAVSSLQTAVDRMKSVKVEADKEILKELKKQNELLANLQVNPVVNVKAPNVSVQAPEVDLSGVSAAIESLRTEEPESEIDLECYKAQDMDSDPSFQYVGFVSPDGGWYIIENDIEGNSLRYVFGASNYMQAWKNRNSLSYRLLNEAINAVQA